MVDALLGTGVRGALREPIREASRSSDAPVPRLPGRRRRHSRRRRPLDPETVRPGVVADLTVTFHRPKTGLLTRRGARYAGKVLVAPIGIPVEADRG